MQDWPDHLPLPPFAVVDYDTEGAADDEIVRFDIGNSEAEALCRSDTPTVFESLPDALSPRAVLAALDEPVRDDLPEPLAIARQVRQSVLDLDARINAGELAPTGDDYNALYLLAEEMDKRGGRLAVVVAGYEKKVYEEILGFNTGMLANRIRRRFELSDFSDP